MTGLKINTAVVAAILILSLAAQDSQAAKLVTGSEAPDFEYTDIEGNTGKLSDLKGKYVVIEWFNHGCPFVAKHYNSEKMQSLQSEYTRKDVVWIAVNSTAEGYGDHRTPQESKRDANKHGTTASHIVIDSSGDIGTLYGAKTTPHIFIVNPGGTLIYQGAADDIKSTDTEDIPKATNYIDLAMTEALTPVELTNPETKPYGCSVKY
jgi:peroxiredoxin